jgi:hypothetical protein
LRDQSDEIFTKIKPMASREAESQIKSTGKCQECNTILVCEDDVFNKATLESIMKEYGLAFDWAQNGREGV